MKQGQIIFWLFVPPNEQAAKAVHPRMTAFRHPTPRFEARFSLDGLSFFPARANMGRKAELMQDVAHLIIVIAFIQTYPLRLVLGRLGMLEDDALDRRTQQLHIVTIGARQR